MGIVANSALRGSSGQFIFLPLLAIAFFATFDAAPVFAEEAATTCTPVVGRVVSIQGTVEIRRRAGNRDWTAISRLDTQVCAGDLLRTGAGARAALFVQSETLARVDQNTTIALSQTPAETIVEFFQDELSQSARNAGACGAGYFISRFPKKLKVTTPYLNAAVEGTEFHVRMQCESTELSVLEGAVHSQTVSTGEERILSSGESLVAGPSGPAMLKTIIKPTNAVQWVLYYPPLSAAATGVEVPTVQQCRGSPPPANQACLARRADVLLRQGRSEEALQSVDETLALNPTNADANALRAVIQIAKNDVAAARTSATIATDSAPDNHRAWLALSYALQAGFDLAQALEAARKAQALQPGDSLVNARVAELLLSLGRTNEAEAAARAAVRANPAEALGHTMLGFVHLAQINTKAARADFEAAIASDSFEPLPRLGLGLAIIRDGKLVEGREQLEIAVALDPSSSLLRSYVGKAYYEENTKERDGLASTQFGLAKQLDPNDPTPWFYDAVLRLAENRSVDALESLDTSVEKNDNRAVYRSQFALDDDAASRAASVAGIYESLGFGRLAIVESAKALVENPGNFSAHRELASAYANLPRHDIARVSEALQAQIRQPISLSPVDPLLATDSLLILRGTGPSQFGTYEYNQLFNRNEWELTVDGIAGGRGTSGNQVVASGLEDRVSYSLSELHYETNGFIDNDDAQKSIYDVFVQTQITTAASAQIDLKRTETEAGQTYYPFDPLLTEADTISENADSVRLSGHYVASQSNDWIWSGAYEEDNRAVRTSVDNALFTTGDAETKAIEAQNLWRFGELRLVSGGAYVDRDQDFKIGQSNIKTTAAVAYVYGQWRPKALDLSVVAGLAQEWFDLDNSLFPSRTKRNHLGPKLGLVWAPAERTTVRAAAFSSVRRPFVRDQTLEPTQVAGFNQFFTGFEQYFGDRDGTVAKRAGLAVDQALSRTTFIGAEVAGRRLDVPTLVPGKDFQWDETTGNVYFYRSFGGGARWQTAISVDGEYEQIERPHQLTGAEGIRELKTYRAPVALRIFDSNGITIRLATAYVKQEGSFSAGLAFGTFEKDDDAWITDLSIDYRLPARRGSIGVGVNNLTDNFIDLLETDPLNPRNTTRRLVFGKVRLNL